MVMSFRLAAMRRRSTVRPMQDRELVAAIVNGEPEGLAEAYDRYAAALYAYCRSMLPDPHPPDEAADAVTDTFTIATAKLQGLRDPDQFGSWLHAVARNECLRRGGTARLASDGAAGLAPRRAARRAGAPGGRAVLAEPQADARVGVAEHGDVPGRRAHAGPEHIAGHAAVIVAVPVALALALALALAVPLAIAVPLVVASADPRHPAGDPEQAGAGRGPGQAGQRDVHRESGGRPGWVRHHQPERQSHRVTAVRVASRRRLLDHGHRDGTKHGRAHRASHR